MTDPKLLLVDDDANLLQSFQRQLRKRYPTDTAQDAQQGMAAVRENGPYALVISDYRMPGMNGIDFLAQVKHASPDTVRVLLTGYADLEVAIKAVNEGSIFRLLTKPCPPEILVGSIRDGLRQWDLVHAEKELLEKTLRGSIKVLSEVLSLIKPEAYGRLSRIMPYVRGLSARMDDHHPWQTESAAMLCLLGFISLPEQIIKRVDKGRALTAEEFQEFSKHPAVAAQLISHIPRMEGVARIISYQEKRFDGTGIPADDVRGQDIPLGARILKAVLDFDQIVAGDVSKADAVAGMRRRLGWYDNAVLDLLAKLVSEESQFLPKSVALFSLKERMVLDETLYMIRGGKMVKVLGKGTELTATSIEYLKRLSGHVKINEPVKILDPVGGARK